MLTDEVALAADKDEDDDDNRGRDRGRGARVCLCKTVVASRCCCSDRDKHRNVIKLTLPRGESSRVGLGWVELNRVVSGCASREASQSEICKRADALLKDQSRPNISRQRRRRRRRPN